MQGADVVQLPAAKMNLKDTIGGEDMYFRRKTDILDIFKSRLDRHIFKNRHYETPHRNRGSPETFNCTQIIF